MADGNRRVGIGLWCGDHIDHVRGTGEHRALVIPASLHPGRVGLWIHWLRDTLETSSVRGVRVPPICYVACDGAYGGDDASGPPQKRGWLSPESRIAPTEM